MSFRTKSFLRLAPRALFTVRLLSLQKFQADLMKTDRLTVDHLRPVCEGGARAAKWRELSFFRICYKNL